MIKVRCTICERLLPGENPTAHPWFPFCGERCRLIDLGRWLGGAYRLDAEQPEESADVTADDLEVP